MHMVVEAMRLRIWLPCAWKELLPFTNDEGLGNPGVLQFLEHMRDEFKKVARKDSRGSPSSFNSLHIQDQLVPIIHRLISSLEHVSQTSNNWIAESPLPHHVGLSPSPSDANGQMEAASSTKAPLLGKFSKQEKKKKMKDPVIAMRDIELEEHRKSTDRGIKIDSGNSDSNSQGGVGSSISLQKDLGSIRISNFPSHKEVICLILHVCNRLLDKIVAFARIRPAYPNSWGFGDFGLRLIGFIMYRIVAAGSCSDCGNMKARCAPSLPMGCSPTYMGLPSSCAGWGCPTFWQSAHCKTMIEITLDHIYYNRVNKVPWEGNSQNIEPRKRLKTLRMPSVNNSLGSGMEVLCKWAYSSHSLEPR
ncbi:Phytolongin Phyl1.1 [Vitis vinifera]|uniref:Phytolongin Phyl1.1 n=1 Tax=Vitis vinifera TaxID=29760 RepID=A0A438HGJ8_VITVI|nr:Phytolongin Phyl1.1 [Vitis vinifera]